MPPRGQEVEDEGQWGPTGCTRCVDTLRLSCHAPTALPECRRCPQPPAPEALGWVEAEGLGRCVLRPPGTAHTQGRVQSGGVPGGVPRGGALTTQPASRLCLPRNDCRRDAVTIALVNSMTSLYAAIVVFSVLGFKATQDHGRCLDG